MGLMDGKVVIITGAGGGLGRSHALLFAQEGASVVVNDLGGAVDGTGSASTPADEVVHEILEAGGKAVANYDDVTTDEGGESLVNTALEQFGLIDVVVNNAGILRDKMFSGMTVDQWDAVMRVHTRALYCVTQPAFQSMKDRAKEGNPGGVIISTTSATGLVGNPGQSNYATAKAGVAGFTLTMAKEGDRYGILAYAISPVASTRMTKKLGITEEQASPKLVSPVVVALASQRGEAAIPSGTILAAGAGWVKHVQVMSSEGHHFDGAFAPDEVLANLPDILIDEGSKLVPAAFPI